MFHKYPRSRGATSFNIYSLETCEICLKKLPTNPRDLMPRERQLHADGGGYLTEVLEEFPSWNRQVMRLHLKTLHLDYALRSMRNRIRDEKSWEPVADQLSCELRDWMQLFSDLHRAETSLVMEAMLLDIGPGD